MKELHKYPSLVIGYSGGPDSQALLYKVIDSGYPRNSITLVHINHGISENAQKWEDFCRNEANKLGVKFFAYQHQLKDIPNLEAVARDIRYNHFLEHLEEGGALLTGHHSDDQVESLLLAISRGAGLAGLACMPEIKDFGDGYHYRPLLNKSKDDLINYLNKKGIESVNDESNQEQDHNRNFFRNSVLPLIRSRYPSFNKSALKTVNNAKEALKEINSENNVTFELKPVFEKHIEELKPVFEKYVDIESAYVVSEENINLSKINVRNKLISEAARFGIELTQRDLNNIKKQLLDNNINGGNSRVDIANNYKYWVVRSKNLLFFLPKIFIHTGVDICTDVDKSLHFKNKDRVIYQNKEYNFKKFCEEYKIPLWIKNKLYKSELDPKMINDSVISLIINYKNL